MEYRVRVYALFTCYRVAIYAPQKVTAVWMHGYIPKVILRENSAYFLQSHLMQFMQNKKHDRVPKGLSASSQHLY